MVKTAMVKTAMVKTAMVKTAGALVGAGRGLLAMDESTPTCDRRFAAGGIPRNVQTRLADRELLITTHGLTDYVSGAILYDETIRQSYRHGRSLVDRLNDAGIFPGIKVDNGTTRPPNADRRHADGSAAAPRC